jgi:tripartite-type tricarboxylate transporter receptor subunit TctC
MSRNLNRRHFIAAGAAAIGVPLLPYAAPAQEGATVNWPVRAIKIISAYPAGGQTDVFARTYGEYIAKQVGQTVVVDNKVGAGGALASVELKRAAPDGYTLMFANTTTIMNNRVTMKEPGYDPERDFVMVSMMPTGSLPLVVSAKTGAKNLKEFVDYARNTKNVSIGTYAAGSYAHIVITELNKQYGLNMVPVHYRGEAPMWTDVLGQTIDAAIGSYNGALPALQSGLGRVIAVPGKRMSLLPDVATFQEQGATSRAFTLTTFQCCVAPIATPPAIVRKLSNLLVAGGRSESVQKMLKIQGIDEPAMPAEESQKIFMEEAPIWLSLLTGLGLTAT